jgi:uncharacterized RDD family membrane protein YckC
MRIETPEQIGVDLELAGLGSRFLAQLADWFWKILLSLVLLGIGLLFMVLAGATNPFENASPLFIASIVTALYLVWLGYGIFFELRWNGQTPGKQSAQIRVIRQGGAPIDVQAAAVRNLLAVADFLPAFHMLGALLILLTPNRQRLGDLAAGTIVVRERVVRTGPDEVEHLIEHASEEFAFTAEQLAAVVPSDIAIIRSFLQRYKSMDRPSRERLGLEIAERLQRKTGSSPGDDLLDGGAARTYLASLLRDWEQYRRHS